MDVSHDEFDGRGKLCDERFSRGNRRLTDIEGDIKALTKLVTQMAEMQKTTMQQGIDQEQRIRTLEQRRGGWLDKIIAAGIAAAVSSLTAYLFSK